MTTRTLALFLLTSLSLCACTPSTTPNVKNATCNKLKSDLIFNNAPNTRQAEIQGAEQPLTQSDYNNC